MSTVKRKRESNANNEPSVSSIKNEHNSVKSDHVNEDSQVVIKKQKNSNTSNQQPSKINATTSKIKSSKLEEDSEDESLTMKDEAPSSSSNGGSQADNDGLKIKGFSPWIKDHGTEEIQSFPAELKTSKGIGLLGFSHMTSVQRVSMTPLLEGKDVIIQAKTGSGKSLAFIIPMIERIIAHKSKNPKMPGPFALIMVPIRELTTQLQLDVVSVSKFHNITSTTVTGGTSAKASTLYQQSPDVVIANPGRLADWLCKSSTLPQDFFSNLIITIMDEADELHKPGFMQDVNLILPCLPAKQQRAYFSATYPSELSKVIPNYSSTIKITTINTEQSDSMQVDTLDNYTATASNENYNDAVLSILRAHKGVKTMVFCATAKLVKFYEKLLNMGGFPCKPMAGGMKQKARTDTFMSFRGAEGGILISTDVSARGVDMKDVGLVFMIGQPSGTDVFVHRSGRTARAGKSGKCICLLLDWQTGFFSKAKKSGVNFKGEFKIDYAAAYKAKVLLNKMDQDLRESAFRTMVFFMISSGKPFNGSGHKIPTEEVISLARSAATPVFGLTSIYVEPSRNVPLSKQLWDLLNSPL